MDKRRHHELMVEFLTYRRDYLIDIWADLRDEHPNIHADIDDMFAQYLERLDEQIRAWDISRD